MQGLGRGLEAPGRRRVVAVGVAQERVARRASVSPRGDAARARRARLIDAATTADARPALQRRDDRRAAGRDRPAAIVARAAAGGHPQPHSRRHRGFPQRRRSGPDGSAPRAVRSGHAASIREPTMTGTVPAVARLDLMTVEEYMHAGVVTCDPGTPLVRRARTLADERIHASSSPGSSDRERRSPEVGHADRPRSPACARQRRAEPDRRAVAATEIVTVDPAIAPRAVPDERTR